MIWTDERHQAAKGRCEALTTDAGYWTDEEYDPDEDGWCVLNGQQGIDEHMVLYVPRWASEYDTMQNILAFVTQARRDLPDALAEIERLRAENAELRDDIVNGHCPNCHGTGIAPLIISGMQSQWHGTCQVCMGSG